jgi:NAD(P)-dependent dehydrogenase (short-subunit alcohol dehydrogenase family)
VKQGTTWLITGATGIAAATARVAAQKGAAVFLAALGDGECQALAAEIREAGGRCHFRAGDLTVAANANAAVACCLDVFGRVDALFNVAGISGRRYGDGPVHECTEEGWDVTLTMNARSTFLVCRAAIGHMMARKSGAILNMSSVSALAPEPRHFAAHAYAAAKGAIAALTRSMAAYYAPMGIRVNALAPGSVRTPMSRRAQADPGIVNFLRVKQPLAGGFIEPDEIAGAACYLLSDEARAVTGQVFVIDAGWSLPAALSPADE